MPMLTQGCFNRLYPPELVYRTIRGGYKKLVGKDAGENDRFHFHPALGSRIYISLPRLVLKECISPTRFWAEMREFLLFLFF